MQELQGLAQQLTGLQHQLQDSTLEVHRLEEEAGALDHKAVQLQLELDQAQRAHSDAQRHLQVSTRPVFSRHPRLWGGIICKYACLNPCFVDDYIMLLDVAYTVIVLYDCGT